MPDTPVDISAAPVVEPDSGPEDFQIWGQEGAAADAPVRQFPVTGFAKAAQLSALQIAMDALSDAISAQSSNIGDLQNQVNALQVIIDNGGISPTPVNLTPPVISDPAIGVTVTVTPGTYEGSITPVLSGQWYINGVAVSGATATTFTPSTGAGGQLNYIESATFGGTAITTPSAPKTIGGALGSPALANVEITPDPGFADTVFTVGFDATGNPAPTIAVRWFLDAVEVGGATGTTFTPDATGAPLTQALTAEVTASSSSGPDAVVTSPAAVVNGPPVAAQALPDIGFDVDTVDLTISTATDFTGVGLTYDFVSAPASLSINPTTGVITSDGSPVDAVAVTVRASNPAGSAVSSFSYYLSTIPDAPVATIDVGPSTIAFAEARNAGLYPVNGAWVRGASTVNSATPTAASGQNGQRLNPWAGVVGLTGGVDQPWDSRNLDYDGTLITPLPVSLAEGDALVKADSSATIVNMRSADTYIGEFQSIHCVTAVPDLTSLRPPIRGGLTNSRANWKTSTVAANMGIFRSQLDLTGATFDGHRAERADRLTRMRSLNNSWVNYWSTLRDSHAGNGLDGYGRDYAYVVGRALLDLHSTDMLLSDKTDLAEGFAQHAIDIFGMMEDGAEWQDNGGWTHGRMVVLYVGGHLLQDQDMLDYVLRPGRALFSEQKTYQYVQPANPAGVNGIYVGNGGAVEGSSGERPNYIIIPEGMEGMPHWGIQPYRGLTVNSAHPVPSYGWLNFSTQSAIVLGIDLLDLTSGGISEDLSSIDAYREAIDRMTRIKANSVAGEPLADVAYFDPGGGDVTATVFDDGVLDLYMNTTTNRRALWTGKPEPSLPPVVTATGTTANVEFHPWWDAQSTSLAITERAVRWSNDDGATWTVIEGIAAAASDYDITGLPVGADILVQTRCRNSAGWGGWSTNQPNYIQHPTDLANNGPAPAAATAVRGLVATGAITSMTAITIDELEVPVYDSDPNNTGLAAVPLTGTHDADGSSIRIRIVKATGGAEVVGWQTFSAGAGGVWSRTVNVPPSMDKLVAVVEAVGNAAVTDTQASGWFSGYIVANVGQSLAERPYDLETSLVPAFAATDEKVWILRNTNTTGTTPTIEAVSGTDEALGLRRLTKVVAEYYDAPLLLVEMTKVGTGESQWADDSKTSRDWFPTGPDAIAWLEDRGTKPSILFRSWFTNDAGVQDNFARHFAPFWLKKSIGGLSSTDSGTGVAQYTTGLVNVATGQAYTPNHFMYDLNDGEVGNAGLFDPAYTKTVQFFGRSQRITAASDPLEITDQTNSIPFSQFSGDTNNKQDMFAFGARRALEEVAAWQPISLNSVAGWTGWAAFGGHMARVDATHVASGHVDGEPLVATHYGHAMARALRQLPQEEPEIKNVIWEAAGAYADVEISLPHGGQLSTPLIRHGAGDYTGSFEGDNWVTATLGVGDDGGSIHTVMGFGIIQSGTRTILGFDAVITDTGTGTGAARRGVVRITPDTAFVDGDGLGYAYGDGSQTLTQVGAQDGAVYQRRLIETRTHVSGAGYGYPVIATVGEPRKFVASGITPPGGGGGGGPDFFTLGADTAFERVNAGTGIVDIAFETDVSVGSLPTVYNYLLAQSASYLGFAVGSGGLLRGVTIKDTNNVAVFPSENAATGALAIGTFANVKFSANLGATPHAKVWVDDVLVLDRTVNSSTTPTEFESNRNFFLFGRPGDSLGAGTRIASAKFWLNESSSTGDFSGFGTPDLELDGAASLASINGLSGNWIKTGADVT